MKMVYLVLNEHHTFICANNEHVHPCIEVNIDLDNLII